MKYKIMLLVLVIIMSMMSFSCSNDIKENKDLSIFTSDKKVETTKRIHALEYNWATGLAIVEVDGHEYLVRDDGGIYHLESCPCKMK